MHVTQEVGKFQQIQIDVPSMQLTAGATQIRAAGQARPVQIGGPARAAVEPAPESFASAAAWTVNLPHKQLEQTLSARDVDDVLCEIDFVGDIGRLFVGTRLIDDWYYWGSGNDGSTPWQTGLKAQMAQLKDTAQHSLTVSVLPLRADAPIYLPKKARPDFAGASQTAQLMAVRLRPVYKITIH
jgi:hypothetical protein